ncbi:MAG: EpsG family protein [Clostridia bacterium]|nr:EpsG family protein [Clostridia bacterium]
MLPVFFSLLIVLLSVRHISIGNDTYNYAEFFARYIRADFSEVFKYGSDFLYWLLNWLVGKVTQNFQWFLTIVALLSVIPVAKVYCDDREYGFLKIILFVNMSTFVMLFSGLRQVLAMAMGLVAYEFVRKKKFWWFLIFATVALGFHHSAFVVYLFYPLYHVSFKKKHLWFIVPGLLLVFIFNKPIFTWATSILNSVLGEKYAATIENTGAYTMLILFALFLVLAYVLPDEKKMDRETIGLRNFLIMAVILQCFAPVHTLAMRLNYYFVIFIPVLIPKILKNTKSNYKEVAWLASIVLTAFFTVYYLYTTYVSCKTGISSLNTYPYVPFWK